jgi:hypothetical protein
MSPRPPPVDLTKFPEFGKLRGKPVRLADAPDRLSPEDLTQVTVVLPNGGGTVRPWRFASDASDVVFLTLDGKKHAFI